MNAQEFPLSPDDMNFGYNELSSKNMELWMKQNGVLPQTQNGSAPLDQQAAAMLAAAQAQA